MFKLFIFVAFLALATAAKIPTAENKEIVAILSQGEEQNADGSFSFHFEDANGFKREESGYVKNAGTEDEALVVKGFYSYLDINGDKVVVEYIADENGFQPQGNIIPQVISQSAVKAAEHSTLELKQQRLEAKHQRHPYRN